MGILACNQFIILLHLNMCIQLFGCSTTQVGSSPFRVKDVLSCLSEGKMTHLTNIWLEVCAWRIGGGESTENSKRQDMKDQTGLCCKGPTDQPMNFEFYTVDSRNIKGA